MHFELKSRYTIVSKTIKVAEPMKEGNRKKALASHAERVFQAPDVNNGVVDVEKKILKVRERK